MIKSPNFYQLENIHLVTYDSWLNQLLGVLKQTMLALSLMILSKKKWTDENDIICWHYDHAKQRYLRGVNILNCIYHNDNGTLALSFEIIKGTNLVTNPKTGKTNRQSEITQNELFE